MSRTTTREIVRVCTELARLDRKGKEEVMHYLQEEIAKLEPKPKPEQPVTYKEGEEK